MCRRLQFAFAGLMISCMVSQPSLGASRRQRSATTIQASVSEEGLALLSSPGFAKILDGGKGLRRIRVRRNERLEAVEETRNGLVTAGVRRDEDEWQLVLIEADHGGVRRLPSPPAVEALRLRPILLVEAGRLVGAAWLEGPGLQRLRVKTADWSGSQWGPVATVSAPSSGSQTGLTGTVLSDGSTLLVWSQFDGADDELFFSWRRSVNWSAPQRVSSDNMYPDVSPSATFQRRGALIAWSRFDGSTYSVWTAEFHRGKWKRERVAGESGSLFPQLIHRQGSLFLVSRSSIPRGWSIRRLAEEGRSERFSFAASESSNRPVLTKTSDASVTRSWPQERRMHKASLQAVP
jgi:hypothetical protein